MNISLEELSLRIHELPSRDRRLIVFDVDPVRARWARSRLRARGRENVEAAFGNDWLKTGAIEIGPSAARLWEPHGLLVEAMEICRTRWGNLKDRRALELACGTGRDAVYLSLRGFEVEAWDLLPDALERCDDLARRYGGCVKTVVKDIEREPFLPVAKYDLISCFNYLHRPLMPAILAAVRPGGVVVYETFVTTQRELFGKPRGDDHLLKPGELREYFDESWNIVGSREGLAGPRRYVASIICIKKIIRRLAISRDRLASSRLG